MDNEREYGKVGEKEGDRWEKKRWIMRKKEMQMVEERKKNR